MDEKAEQAKGRFGNASALINPLHASLLGRAVRFSWDLPDHAATVRRVPLPLALLQGFPLLNDQLVRDVVLVDVADVLDRHWSHALGN